MTIKKLKKSVVINILSAVAIAVFGFILLNITFLLDFLFQSLLRDIIKLFIPLINEYWLPQLMHLLFAMTISLVSWFIFCSKINRLLKAIYMSVPAAVVLVTIGIFLYRWPIAVYSVGGLFSISTIYYLYRTKQPWLYYYTVILVTLVLSIATLLGMEI